MTTQKMDAYHYHCIDLMKLVGGPAEIQRGVQESRMYVVQPRRNGPKYRLDQRSIPLEVRSRGVKI